MSSLICGSLAFDTITDFPGRFAEHILPDKVHMLNVAFLVPTLRREFGGCAGNIAYSLKLLGGEPLVLAALGEDGQDYQDRLDAFGISRAHVHVAPRTHTAQAHIITDRDNNQITAFHPGAMSHAHEKAVPAVPGLRLGIIAPDGRQAMLDHAAQMAAAGLPFVFDPGQGLPMFDGEELRAFVRQASWVAVNDYEAAMLSERTGWSLDDIATHVRGIVVTQGAQGCEVREGGAVVKVPGLQAARVVDPTGCGDAFRGALLWALEQGWSLADASKLGNVLGARKIAHAGPQNYSITLGEALAALRQAYGEISTPATQA
ncbi:MAG: carbohydrate kinase family protein [Betaproteobacteria bacterium]|jgi:adenosine kinase|nr:carbohydrate kinase family protein [Thiomonas sp.]MDE2128201.1 carbohydrate kinase family protein [Betaproteobacteria bacterium]OZB43955.1 MAG: carbohydrate kinase family protein [Thiomonas sp. 15-66-11]